MPKIKTSELTDTALDWAVAKAKGKTLRFFDDFYRERGEALGYDPVKVNQHLSWELLKGKHVEIIDSFTQPQFGDPEPIKKAVSIANYSIDWSQGGPIIEREIGNLWKHNKVDKREPDVWTAAAYHKAPDGTLLYYEDGPTPLIAAMRCYVASKLGNTVDVPEELNA